MTRIIDSVYRQTGDAHLRIAMPNLVGLENGNVHEIRYSGDTCYFRTNQHLLHFKANEQLAMIIEYWGEDLNQAHTPENSEILVKTLIPSKLVRLRLTKHGSYTISFNSIDSDTSVWYSFLWNSKQNPKIEFVTESFRN
jgi:hypothetical protein